MSSKALQAATIICAVTASVLFIVALASSSWLLGCIKYENIFNAIKNAPSISERVKNSVSLSAEMMKDTELCIHQGILKLTLEAGSLFRMDTTIPVTSLPTYQVAGVLGMILAIGFSILGASLIIYAASRNSDDYSEKSTASIFVRKAMIGFIVAGIFGLCGMAIYSIGTAQAAHDPLLFFAHFGQTEMGTELQKLGSKFADELTPLGRGKRDISIDDLNMNAESKQYLRTMLDGLEPGYGYAFYLAWLAVIVVIASVVLAAQARKYLLSLPYSDGRSVKL